MKSEIRYKVPNGKLLNIQLCYDEHCNKIQTISISGDFFAYPEEAIELLERKLVNIELNESSLSNVINDFVNTAHVQFIGINAESLTKTILMCGNHD